MPELPDIEGYRRMIEQQFVGAQVRNVHVLDAGVVRNATPEALRVRLLGRTIVTAQRRGKWLLIATTGPTLLIHSGMTGRLYVTDVGDARVDRYDRVVVTIDSHDLHYADLRKLRGLWLVDDEHEVAAIIGRQGPDALDLSAPAFRAALEGRRIPVKSALMNQQVISGLGNMLSDEILWRAHLNPARPVDSLGDDDVRRLHQATQRTVRAAAEQGRIPRTRTWLSSTRNAHLAACPRCRTTLTRTSIGGRTSIWCPHCQPPATGETT